MAKLNVKVPHLLKKEKAIERAKVLLNEVKTQFADNIEDFQVNWDGDTGKFSFKVMGSIVEGILRVTQRGVNLSGNFPDDKSYFQKMFESTLKKRAETLLAKLAK
ncbi:MAG TPA: polyhydroxyalkanoic acid system family protein [Candidatus Paceibacterota bacterium]|nr:polyhydroxyalkanoic acid system family protein [Candidatus Paceibacterota bacterium]